MYKCLLKNDMNVVTGNFRNNRQNVKVSRAKKILLKKKFSYAVSGNLSIQ